MKEEYITNWAGIAAIIRDLPNRKIKGVYVAEDAKYLRFDLDEEQ